MSNLRHMHTLGWTLFTLINIYNVWLLGRITHR